MVVEPFKEWVIDESQLKDPALKLKDVHYAKQLEPYIERKLFSVNTGHATVAYTGQVYGYDTIGEAIKDKRVLDQVKAVLAETRELLLAKWDFERAELEAYQQKIIERFENPELQMRSRVSDEHRSASWVMTNASFVRSEKLSCTV